MNIMNSTSLTSPSSNIQFLNVCRYINTFSIFFASHELMTIDDQNQYVPVINALFEYLNKYPNESETKMELLLNVLNKSNILENGNKTLDMKYVNETYQYILNVGLFQHCGNITGYLAENRIKTRNVISSALWNIVLQNLSDSYMCNNLCFSNCRSTKLSPLVITKLMDCIWGYCQGGQTGIISNDGKYKLGTTRFRRQPPEDVNTNNGSQSDIASELDLLIDDAAILKADEDEMDGLNFDLLLNFVNSDKGKDEFFKNILEGEKDVGELSNENEIIPPEPQTDESPETDRDLLTAEEAGSLANENEPRIEQSSVTEKDLLTAEDIGPLANENEPQIEKSPETKNDLPNARMTESLIRGNKSKIEESLETETVRQKIRRYENYIQTSNVNVTNEDTNVFDRPGTSRSLLYQYLTTKNDNGKSKRLQSMEKPSNVNVTNEDTNLFDRPGTSRSLLYQYLTTKNDNGKSKRLQSIEKAAGFVSSRMHHLTFNNSVNMLKGYLLKLENIKTEVPTYDQLAWDICYNSSALPNYATWQIPNHKFIDDVLFEANFNNIDTFEDVEEKFKGIFYGNIKNLMPSYFEIYKNSLLLQQSLRVEDFLLLKFYLSSETRGLPLEKKQRINAALYRLALRECEEEWTQNNITLYGVQNSQNIHRLKFDMYYYTFIHLIEFSTNRENEESKLIGPVNYYKRLIEYEIEFKNQAGVVDISRIFDNDTVGRYIIPVNTKLPIIYKGPEFRGEKTVDLFRMQDNDSKEKKMIDIVSKLHKLFKDVPKLIAFYN